MQISGKLFFCMVVSMWLSIWDSFLFDSSAEMTLSTRFVFEFADHRISCDYVHRVHLWSLHIVDGSEMEEKFRKSQTESSMWEISHEWSEFLFQSLYEVEITYINNELVEVEQYLMVLKPGLTDRFEMTSLRVLRRMTQSNPLSVQCKIGYVVSLLEEPIRCCYAKFEKAWKRHWVILLYQPVL